MFWPSQLPDSVSEDYDSKPAYPITKGPKKSYPHPETITAFEDAKGSLKESTFSSIVLPVFQFLHWINIIPNGFETDANGNVRVIKASLVRRVISAVFQSVIVLHIFGSTELIKLNLTRFPFLVLMYHGVTLGYVAFNVAWYLTINFNRSKIENLFGQIRNFEMELLAMGYDLPRPRTKKLISWCILGCYLLLALSYSLIMRLNGLLLLHSFNAFAKHNAGTCILEINLFLGLNIGYNAETGSREINGAIAAAYTIFTFLLDISWTFGFLMGLLWAGVYVSIFKAFFHIVHKSSGRNTLEDIRRFNRITFLVNDFNDIYAVHTLSAVFSGSLHFSVYMSTFLMAKDNRWVATMTLVSFLTYWFQIFAAAEVSNAAQKMGDTLKLRYQNEPVWKRNHAACTETLQGIVIVFNEMLGGSIGFKGWGFFTISYSFIGSVLSLIATYAIVAMQMYGMPTPS